MYDHTDYVALRLMAMTDREFVDRYVERQYLTPEDVYAKRTISSSAPEEGEHLPVMVDFQVKNPSELRYIRTWDISEGLA